MPRKRRRVSPPLKLSPACGGEWGWKAVTVESWQRPPAAAGRVEKMISNPEKCRPDGGPGAREGEGKAAAWMENERPNRVSQRASRSMNEPFVLAPWVLLRVYYVPRQRARPWGDNAGCLELTLDGRKVC